MFRCGALLFPQAHRLSDLFMRPIRKAVFPVAGLGTRFLPATKAMPKEMLPVVDKPLIQYAVEEAVAAGITDLIFVTGRNKRAIEDHFDSAPELEADLAAKNKYEMLTMVRNILPANVNCLYIRQSAPLGLGHAVLTAAPAIGDEPFAVPAGAWPAHRRFAQIQGQRVGRTGNSPRRHAQIRRCHYPPD